MSLFRQPKDKKHQVLHAVLIGLAVILFWRGIWGLMDLYLFPSNELISYITSAIIGIIILYITHHITKELE
ncbi:hypothetical protein CL629_03130 [bacterium]|nr:hypothetical protein [bacterium]|tara:strand:+ start:1799 stop:2011 length:213 start_codon:yes stop_codon:yes gene_type:complete